MSKKSDSYLYVKRLEPYLKTLSHEDELRLSEIIQKENHPDQQQAIDDMFFGNVRFVASQARRFAEIEQVDVITLISGGNEGLIHAIMGYTPYKFNPTPRFMTYAGDIILKELRAVCRNLKSGITPSQHEVTKKNRLRKLLAENPDCDDVEIRETLGISQNLLNRLRSGEVVSMHANLPGTNIPREEVLSDTDDHVAYNLVQQEDYALVQKILSKLPCNEQEILKQYYKDQLKLQEIADKYSLTSERIRQIKEKALEKVRKELSKYDEFSHLF